MDCESFSQRMSVSWYVLVRDDLLSTPTSTTTNFSTIWIYTLLPIVRPTGGISACSLLEKVANVVIVVSASAVVVGMRHDVQAAGC